SELPATRYFGFNNPSPSPGQAEYGYEEWVTVPDSAQPSGPVAIKQFAGGLYAVVTTYLYEIGERWQKLVRWVQESAAYELDERQCLEETVNTATMHSDNAQLDLFLPIRRK
ncbi:MAG TPA: effector binding domain-containing protein, partial [Symbiobacteriaceae bacterium]|nr:effector binding domain-containing protein [Symbiobacteriaceae bacterium]